MGRDRRERAARGAGAPALSPRLYQGFRRRLALRPAARGNLDERRDPRRTRRRGAQAWPARAHSYGDRRTRSEEHTSELQSLMRISYAVFCLKKKQQQINTTTN